MIYVITLAVGIISGFLISNKARLRGPWILLGLGALFLAMALLAGRHYSYSDAAMVDLFTLVGDLDEHGVRRYCAIGYAGMIGSAVSYIRAVVGRAESEK